MHLRPILFLSMLLGGLALAEEVKVEKEKSTEAPRKDLKGYDADGGRGKTIYAVPIEGTIDLGLAPLVERVSEEAGPEDIILLEIKTFGGRIDGAVRIRDALLDAKATTIAFIDRRAISAGALISLACDTIIMSPGASIGAATPVQLGGGGEAKPTSEKVVSYMRAEMRATAEAKGRRADLAEAMVDPDLEIKGVTEKGKLLTLTTDEALKLKLADASAKSSRDAIAMLNLTEASWIRTDTDWGEKLARLLTDPVISSMLMTFGFLGLLMEFYTPGFGVGGAIGLGCLGLFFFGQYAANLAGWEEMILFAVGFALIMVEIFVIPGFGVAGVVGIISLGAAVVMALMEVRIPFEVSFELGYFQEALGKAATRLAIVMVVGVVATFAFGKLLPKTKLGSQFILSAETSTDEGYVSQAQEEQDLLGKRGLAQGTLRPAGIAMIDGERVDVVSRGGYIDEGAEIEVIKVDGNRIVVKKIT